MNRWGRVLARKSSRGRHGAGRGHLVIMRYFPKAMKVHSHKVLSGLPPHPIMSFGPLDSALLRKRGVHGCETEEGYGWARYEALGETMVDRMVIHSVRHFSENAKTPWRPHLFRRRLRRRTGHITLSKKTKKSDARDLNP